MATLLSDTFDRANSTSVVGSPQTGPAPTVLTRTCGILTNSIYCSAVVGDGGIVVWDLGTPNVELTFARAGITGTGGAAFCVVSATDYIYADAGIGAITLFRRSTAGMTPIAAAKVSMTAGDAYTLSMKDGVFRAVAKGVEVMRQPVPLYTANNRHGFRFAATTNPSFQSVVGVDSAVLPAMPETGNMREPARIASTPPPIPAGFPYRGRDTKAQDTAGVA